MRLSKTLFLALLLATGISNAQSPAQAVDARPELLKALDGNWVMSGDVRGKPVTYSMNAAPALERNFTEMRMHDTQVPAKYEARVFIGYDTASATVIVHWMDVFGARYSIPHATGHIVGNNIEFTFAYPDGPFRDTLSYHPESKSWTLVLESSKPDGSWAHFARYDIRRQ
jgi:hypothetical protein